MLTAYDQTMEPKGGRYGWLRGGRYDISMASPDPFGLGFEDGCLTCHKYAYGLRNINYYCHRVVPARTYLDDLYLDAHFVWIAETLTIPPTLYIPPTSSSISSPPITLPMSPLPPPPEVLIDMNAYTPPIITVPVGTTITWVNPEQIVHHIIAERGGRTAGDRFEYDPLLDIDPIHFNSGPFDSIVFNYTFIEVHSFHWYCTVHPDERGQIVVE
jgi:plastocyanin